MRRDMMDFLMSRDGRMGMPYMRDGRNPYGSRRRDRMRSREEYDDYEDDSARSRNSMGRYTRDGHHMPRGYYGEYGDTPFYVREDNMYDYGRGRDYSYGREYPDYGEDKLNKRELDEWIDKLLKELSPDEKEMLKFDKIIKRAKDMGIKFEKMTEDEFYVTVLMVFTDYKDSIGKSNLDMYIRIAKDWLCDPDAGVQYGEKLAAYYDYIVRA